MVLLKILVRQGTRKSRKNYQAVIDALYPGLGVRRITSQTLSNILPVYSHVLVKPKSRFFNEIDAD